jgi:chromosome partitioning protein
MPRIHGVSPFNVPAKVTRTFAMRIPNEVERIVVDTPAAINKHQYIEFTRKADRILIPVLPSDIDIQAVTRCIADLLLYAKIQRGENRMAVIANRVKRNTAIFGSLMRFLESLKIPVIAVRDSQNYIRAAESGVGLHEMKGSRFRVDQAHWESLVDWIEDGKVPSGETAWDQVATGEAATDDETEAEMATEAVTEATAESTAVPEQEPPLRLFGVSAFINRDS